MDDGRAGPGAVEAAWTAGDASQVFQFQQEAAAEFVARLALAPGTCVLDVGCGSGNAALAAARAGATATGVDISGQAIGRARDRAAAEGAVVRFDEGDVERLPYEDASFDVVLSLFGVMFAPHPERAAAELARVCRAGGRIVLASWTPDSFIARLYGAVAGYIALPPHAPFPFHWGEEGQVHEWLWPYVSELRFDWPAFPLQFPLPPGRVAELYQANFGPIRQAFATLDPARRRALRQHIERLVAAHSQSTGAETRISAEYLEVRGVRRE